MLLGAVAAEAQTSRILVSNASQGSDDTASTGGNDHAQLFRTAGATNGYTLTSVTVVSEDAEGDAFDVEICAEDGTANEFPSTTASDCTALTAPASFTAGNLEFTHAGLALSANTNYVVVIKPRAGANVAIDSTTAAGEDSTGLSGWSIKNYFYWNNSGTWTNQSGTNEVLQITVNGYEVVLVAPPVITTGTEIWSGTVAVASLSDTDDAFGYTNFRIGSFNFSFGALSDADFDLQGTTYNIPVIRLNEANVPANTTRLTFSLETNIAANSVENLVLTVGTIGSYALADSDVAYQMVAGITNFTWDNPGLSAWSASDMITFSLRDTSPVAPTVTGIALTSIPTNATYGISDEVEATVTFSAAVDITGTPQLELDFAGTEKAANCTAATNTTTMVCSYEVVADDVAPNGIAIAANKLTLNGGTITATGSTTINADLDHVALAIDAGHKIDGIRPTLVTTGNDAPKTSTDGTKVILTFSETISSVDRTNITIMAGGNVASTSAGSAAGTTVELALTTALTAMATNLTVALAADAVEDTAGNGNLAVAATAVINAVVTAPTVTAVELTSTATTTTYAIGVGVEVEATVTFSAAVDITGTPQLELDFAGTPKAAPCANGTNTTTMVCGYTVGAGDSAPNGIAIAANKLTGGIITATGSTTNNAVLAHAAVAIDAAHKVDGIRPTLVTTGADAPTTSTDGTKVILTFSEDIGDVDGTQITIMAGGNVASTSAGSAAGTKVELDLTTALTATATNLTVALSADAVEDAAANGNLAVPATSVTNAVVTTTAPTVTSVELTSTATTTTYAIGDGVEATVTFNKAVDITGTPQLELDFAGTEKAANCTAATNTTTMVCSYEVVADDVAAGGVAIAANKLTLTGGTITATGSTTNNAVLAHAAVAIDAGHKVDGIRPTLVTTGADAPTTSIDGTKVILTFSEDISSVDRTRITIVSGNRHRCRRARRARLEPRSNSP